MMRSGKNTVAASFVVVFILSMLSFGVFAATVSSPSLQFNVTNSNISINHTNNFTTTVSITANNSAVPFIIIVFDNSSTTIDNVYSQPQVSSICDSTGTGLKPAVLSGSSVNNTFDIDAGSSELATVALTSSQLICAPGRWVGSLNVSNSTLSTENLVIGVTVDIPITSSSTAFNLTSSGGSVFSGTLPGNSTSYHSYFLNTTAFPLATSFLLNLSSPSDLDMFLLDSNSMPIRKSILNGTGSESIVASFLPNSFVEVRIYGRNTTAASYNGTLNFSTLNVSESNLNTISFGTMMPNNVSVKTLNLSNGGDLTQNSVVQGSELYAVTGFLGNTSSQFRVFVPNTASRARFSINWTAPPSGNLVNYSLALISPTGQVISNSTNGFVNANASNYTDVEEHLEITGPVSGFYTMVVSNTTTPLGHTNTYNAVSRIYFDASSWIRGNLSEYSDTTFNASYLGVGVSRPVSLNLTVPNGSIDGRYEGFVSYTSSSGSTVRMPLNLVVQSGMLLVNGTVNTSTYTVYENAGQNVTRTINVPLNNTGSLPLAYNTTRSSYLYLPSDSTRTINFSYTALNDSSGVLPVGSNSTVNVTIDVNTAQSGFDGGTFNGWIFFNSTYAQPYQGHNLTISVSLTNGLRVHMINVLSSDSNDYTINNTASAEVIRSQFQLTYMNNTTVTDNDALKMTTSNFTVYMRHSNFTSYLIPVGGGTMSLSNGTNPMFEYVTAKIFDLGSSVPANSVGGFYDVTLIAVQNNTNSTYVGSSTFNRKINVLNTSLLMSTNLSGSGCSFGAHCGSPSTIDLNRGSIINLSVLVTNFGTVAVGAGGSSAAFMINATESCSAITVSAVSDNCTGGSTSNSAFTGLTPAAGESCMLNWDILSTNDSSECGINLVATPGDNWFSSQGINLTIDPEAGSSSSDDSSSSSGSSSSSAAAAATATTAADSVYIQITKWASIVEAVQGESSTTSVVVKNTQTSGSKTISLKAINLPSEVSVSVEPASKLINGGNSGEFIVTLDILDSLAVDDYSGKFQASDSSSTIEKDFTLHVLPGAAAKAKISSDLANFTAELDLLWKEINSTKAVGGDLNSTEELAIQVRDKLAEAQAQIDLGTDDGYFAASQILEEVANLLNTAKSQLKVDKRTAGFAWPVDPLYIGIGVGVAAIGFLVYLFLPSKGGSGIRIGKHIEKAADAAGAVKDAAGSAAGKASDAAGTVKDATADQFKKLQEKFRLKKSFKYKYEE